MSDILKDYYEALERLKKGKPTIVPKTANINNDTVAIEAGRKKGAIKRLRPLFKDLIDAIDIANAERTKPDNGLKGKLEVLRSDVAKYRSLWEEALTREVSLIKQLWEEREQWAKEKQALTGEKVKSILEKHIKGK